MLRQWQNSRASKQWQPGPTGDLADMKDEGLGELYIQIKGPVPVLIKLKWNRYPQAFS
jgi:hypothetical protein